MSRRGAFQRLPPDEGVADLDIYLLWSADRKFSAAERAFLDALHAFSTHSESASCAR